MKRKGITIWEQYIERFVLGAALLFFLGFTAWQFMSQPNAVDRGRDGVVTPGQIDDLLKERADSLQTRLAPGAPAAIEIPDHQSVNDLFANALDASISPATELIASAPSVVLDTGELAGIEVVYVEPKPPAPHDVRVGQTFDAIDEDFVARNDVLAARFNEPPYDLTWMTVAALFDLEDVRRQYKETAGEDRAPIPTSWHYDRYDILDVKIEREKYVDGVWTNRRVLDVIPGQLSVRNMIGGEVDRAVRDTVLRRVGEDGVQEAILRPDFYDTVNDSWTLPDPRVKAVEIEEGWTEEQKEIGRLEHTIRRLVADRDRKYEQLEEMGGSMDREEGMEEEEEEKEEERRTPPGGTTGGGGSAPPGGGFGTTGGGGERRKGGSKRGAPGGGIGLSGAGASGGGSDARDNTRRIERTKTRIRGLNRKIAVKQRDLAALRGDDGAMEEVVQAEEDPDQVLIYAYDIDVEAGATYRYRVNVEIYNPFFARKTNLLAEQQGLADDITIASDPSAWSEPFEVIPDRKVYITRAYGPDSRNAGQVGMGQATAEVFRFEYGRWWRETFQVEPGNRVGDRKQLRRDAGDDGPTVIDYGTNWFVLDIMTDIDAERSESERGYGATVLLQRLGDGLTMVGDPSVSESDEERAWLRDAVDLADLSGGLASGG